MKQYDVIVVGAGHAGIEAALAAKRMGASVLVLTIHLDMIGHMPCNPAVGGIAKSHLVFEIDALGGEIGFATDKTGIQFKMLNRKKGPSVWSLRAQVDRADYRSYMKKKIMESVDVKQGEVVEILTEGDRAIGVKTKTGTEYYSKTVILTTGTFMQGLVHIGMVRFSAGRLGEPPSTGLSDSLKKLGFELGRLKTGTSARADGRTIDFSKMEIQPGDENPEHFSHRTVEFNPPQIPCYLTHTTPETHEIIRKNIALAPLYAGVIKGIGPRYCPSLEDKVMRFPERGKHHVFVEPDGRDTNEYYLNGVSSSLPEEIQLKFMRTIPGLEQVEFLRPGYAIEYDFVFPTQLRHSLETKKIQGLFLAGQINGTSGYEEAAAQGIMAGINAVLKIRGEEPFVLRRDEAYIGVLIDDLVTRGTKEPYRMFTSRA
ncbi:MAG TPA: tRNA uridine-5-carboxymethylaminomethyl(34) synthesis enzyme MnmG, partial [candidate division WOR-3 bacterium]|nr:tRNA uridine-5-carboxymethylaminomethyl(34) synthesis enzyme MnmG [candidate division WOR-3 bacterium]